MNYDNCSPFLTIEKYFEMGYVSFEDFDIKTKTMHTLTL